LWSGRLNGAIFVLPAFLVTGVFVKPGIVEMVELDWLAAIGAVYDIGTAFAPFDRHLFAFPRGLVTRSCVPSPGTMKSGSFCQSTSAAVKRALAALVLNLSGLAITVTV